jgi:hypothetical protein
MKKNRVLETPIVPEKRKIVVLERIPTTVESDKKTQRLLDPAYTDVADHALLMIRPDKFVCDLKNETHLKIAMLNGDVPLITDNSSIFATDKYVTYALLNNITMVMPILAGFANSSPSLFVSILTLTDTLSYASMNRLYMNLIAEKKQELVNTFKDWSDQIKKLTPTMEIDWSRVNIEKPKQCNTRRDVAGCAYITEWDRLNNIFSRYAFYYENTKDKTKIKQAITKRFMNPIIEYYASLLR